MRSYKAIIKQYYHRSGIYNDMNNNQCKSPYIEGWMDALDWVLGSGERIKDGLPDRTLLEEAVKLLEDSYSEKHLAPWLVEKIDNFLARAKERLG